MDKKLFIETKDRVEEVKLLIGVYPNNGCIFIGLLSAEKEEYYPCGNVTINLYGKVPDYCGYLDVPFTPGIEEFVNKYQLGESTGIYKKAGYYEFPLYRFNVEKLRNLHPIGMEIYEQSIGNVMIYEEAERSKEVR